MSTFITRADSRIERAAAPGAEGGERRLEPVAGADRDELAGLGGEQLADRARVARRTATPVRISAPVSIALGSSPASCVLAVDEGAQRGRVDGRVARRYGVSSTSDSCTILRSETT